MRYLYNFKLFENSSLSKLGVPYDVIGDIQKEYSISNDAQWKEFKYKKDVLLSLRDPKDKLIISVSDDKVLVIFSSDKEYYYDKYILKEEDDFSEGYWDKEDRKLSTLTSLMKEIHKSSSNFELLIGEWTNKYYNKRKLKSFQDKFENFTNQFKRDFAESFTRIVRRMYGRKSNIITNIIINNLKDIKQNLSDEDIRSLLYSNVEKAKDVDKYKSKSKQEDPFKLKNKFIMDNSLTIFNEYLMSFEEEYSEKYGEYFTIYNMCEKWGRDKIMTAFMYYLYSEKLMELK